MFDEVDLLFCFVLFAQPFLQCQWHQGLPRPLSRDGSSQEQRHEETVSSFPVMVMVRGDGGFSEGEFVSLQCSAPLPIWGWKTPVSQNHESYDIQSVLYQSWKDIIFCRSFHDTMSSYGSRVNISLQQILWKFKRLQKIEIAAFFPPLPVSFQREHNARASHSFRGKVYLPLFVRMIHTFFLNYTSIKILSGSTVWAPLTSMKIWDLCVFNILKHMSTFIPIMNHDNGLF